MKLLYSLIVFKIFSIAVEAIQATEFEEDDEGIKATILAAAIKIDPLKQLLPKELKSRVEKMLDTTLHEILDDPSCLDDDVVPFLGDWVRTTISKIEQSD